MATVDEARLNPAVEREVAMTDTQALGRRGERLAARHYRRAGYAILARNLRLGRSELDLVARSPDRRTIVIIEVKTSAISLHRAGAGLNSTKRRRIAAAAHALRRLGLLAGHALRIDGVLIEWSGDRPELRVLMGPVLDGDRWGWGDRGSRAHSCQ